MITQLYPQDIAPSDNRDRLNPQRRVLVQAAVTTLPGNGRASKSALAMGPPIPAIRVTATSVHEAPAHDGKTGGTTGATPRPTDRGRVTVPTPARTDRQFGAGEAFASRRRCSVAAPYPWTVDQRPQSNGSVAAAGCLETGPGS